MGMFDTVMVRCPQCGTPAEFQSKSGSCTLESYSLDEAPDDVLYDVNRHSPATCEKCGTRFGVDVVDPRPCPRRTLIAHSKVWNDDRHDSNNNNNSVDPLAGTCLHCGLTRGEAEAVPEVYCNDRGSHDFGRAATPLAADRPLNQAIKCAIAASPDDDLLATYLTSVRTLSAALSREDLRVAIEVHRSNCRQPNCPVLVVMAQDAATRELPP